MLLFWSALKRMGELGNNYRRHRSRSLLHHNVNELTGRYRTWSQTKAKAETTVAMFYVSDYGYSDRSLSQCQWHYQNRRHVEMIDLRSADAQEVQELIGRCAGIVIAPQLRLEMLPQPRQSSVQS